MGTTRKNVCKGELGIFRKGTENQYNSAWGVSRRESSGRVPYSRGDNGHERNCKHEKFTITHEQYIGMDNACRARTNIQSDIRDGESKTWPNTVHRMSGLGQLVLQGHKRQVQGSNWSNPAQPRRPWGSTQILLSRHNRVKHPCRDSHAVINAWGIAHIPRVVSREDRIQLLSEKDHKIRSLANTNRAGFITRVQLQQGWDQQHDYIGNTITTTPLRDVSQRSSTAIMILNAVGTW